MADSSEFYVGWSGETNGGEPAEIVADGGDRWWGNIDGRTTSWLKGWEAAGGKDNLKTGEMDYDRP